ncbi:MAG: MBL fold metallo-hydrolase [Cellvibrionales bacterium]|nr:MBL fold metallo-hydrolase [Cellvibrionales bacterium]
MTALVIQDFPVPSEGELVEVSQGIFWLRMPLPMSLDHINLYLIDEGDSFAVIDTGMNYPDSQKLWQHIFDKYCQSKPIKKVIVTHMHPDHVGLAGWLCEKFDADLYMTQTEFFATQAGLADDIPPETNIQFYTQIGMPQEFLDFVAQSPYRMSNIVAQIPHQFKRLKGGDTLVLGGNEWQVITGSGHTFEHASLYCKERKLYFSGDQLLPEITSNVSVYVMEPDANPLALWYQSLDALDSLDADTLVFPSHNQPFKGVHARAKAIKMHHDQLLEKVLNCLTEPKTVYELCQMLFPRVDFLEMPLAVGEILAHLHYLMADHRVVCRQVSLPFVYEKM